MTRRGICSSVKLALKLLVGYGLVWALSAHLALANQVNWVPALAANVTESSYNLCNQPYAQCSSAMCMAIPNEPSQALCFCKVMQGNSIGTLSCDARKPHVNQYGNRVLVASFSLVTQEHEVQKKTLKCPAAHPWAHCLDQTCYVNPHDPTKAMCNCTLQRSGEYMTEGAHCDTKMCSRYIWSAATPDENTALIKTYLQKTGSHENVKNAICTVGDENLKVVPHKPSLQILSKPQ